jgi:formate dehydrogenase gamma subunit
MPFGIDILRYEQLFGQRVVAGLSWDILLVFAFISTLVFLVHFVVRDLLNPTEHTPAPEEEGTEQIEDSLRAQGVDEIHRFTAAQRASHWIMAISVFLLLLSGFLIMNNDVTVRAVFGVSWLFIHEVSAVVLMGYVIFHLGHVGYKGTWGEMWFGLRDVRDLWVRFLNLVGVRDEYPKQFKYPSAQKLLHWAVTGATLGLIVTGLVLLRRVRTPFWEPTREFTFLGVHFGLGTAEVGGMGLVPWSFVIHDFLAVAILALVMGHVYFALRPREWGITRSMITGYVSVEDYAEKYSPKSWSVSGTASADGGEPEAADGDDEDR